FRHEAHPSSAETHRRRFSVSIRAAVPRTLVWVSAERHRALETEVKQAAEKKRVEEAAAKKAAEAKAAAQRKKAEEKAAAKREAEEEAAAAQAAEEKAEHESAAKLTTPRGFVGGGG
ncbi:hypothetical protein, partial [Galactobacter valiniphilus]|uniref:hypothetical protein n=1 Tax=Galactobacter valiniphilus TaxID=2676122 RepID=UPI001F3A3C99